MARWASFIGGSSTGDNRATAAARPGEFIPGFVPFTPGQECRHLGFHTVRRAPRFAQRLPEEMWRAGNVLEFRTLTGELTTEGIVRFGCQQFDTSIPRRAIIEARIRHGEDPSDWADYWAILRVPLLPYCASVVAHLGHGRFRIMDDIAEWGRWFSVVGTFDPGGYPASVGDGDGWTANDSWPTHLPG